jgi:hypothetical protein
MVEPSKRTGNPSGDIVNVLLVERFTTVGRRELSVGGLGVAVTIRKVVDDNLNKLLLAGALVLGLSIRVVFSEGRDLGADIEPGKGGDVRNLGCLCSKSSVTNVLHCGSNLSSVVRREPDGVV